MRWFVFILFSYRLFSSEISLGNFLNDNSINSQWNIVTQELVLSKSKSTITIKRGLNVLLYNNSEIHSVDGLVWTDEGIFLSTALTRYILNLLKDNYEEALKKKKERRDMVDSRIKALPTMTFDKNDKFPIIIIDAGHGGENLGAFKKYKNFTMIEKDLVLNASNLLKLNMQKSFPNKLILMTRENDVFWALDDRTHFANEVKKKYNKTPIFISMHGNYSVNEKARGFEVWHLPFDTERSFFNFESGINSNSAKILNTLVDNLIKNQSFQLSGFILDSINKAVGNKTLNRGLRSNNFFVVKNTYMPSVLVELGFLTNEEDAILLNSKDYIAEIVDSIVKGVNIFLSKN